MAEIHDFVLHPIMGDIEASVSHVVIMLARHQWSTKALYVAQELIIDNLLEIEDIAREYKRKAKELRKQAASEAIEAREQPAGITENIKVKTARLYEEAEAYAEARKVLQYGAWLFRYVGDGIAWHAYGHNRRFIRALASKQPVGYLPSKDEFRPMRNLFRAARRLGREWLPVLHDITNCLRTADLSVFKDGSLYRVMELKIRKGERPEHELDSAQSARGDDRARRQEERLERIFRYMATKEMGQLDPSLEGGRAIDSDMQERHNFEAVSAAITQARTMGCGFASPEDPVLYVSWDAKRSTETDVMRAASRRFPDIVTDGVTFRDMNARPERSHQDLPITAMALPAGDILDILFGRVIVMTMINLPVLEKTCAQRGVPLQVVPKRNAGFSLELDTDEVAGEVREGLWNRLALEALSIESFAGLLRSIMTGFEPKASDDSA